MNALLFDFSYSLQTQRSSLAFPNRHYLRKMLMVQIKDLSEGPITKRARTNHARTLCWMKNPWFPPNLSARLRMDSRW